MDTTTQQKPTYSPRGALRAAPFTVALILLLGCGLLILYGMPGAKAMQQTSQLEGCSGLLDFSKRPLLGDEPLRLCDAYQGKVVLIVNTASKCLYTPQYESLEALYKQYREQGLVVLGFPSNDFGMQEPGDEKDIRDFCRLTYGVEFPMFEKTHAAKDKADPLYRALAEAAGGSYPNWNFHKYLIGRDGQLIGSYHSSVEPRGSELEYAIKQAL
jgi:glutathione peroxidase